MAYEYMEDALDGTVAYIAAGLEATLAAVEIARSVTVPRWGTRLSVSGTGQEYSGQYPQIIVAPAGTEPSYVDEGQSWADEHWNYHLVDILTTQMGSDWEQVERDLLRYDEAYQVLVSADYTFGDRFNRVRLGSMDPAGILEAIDERTMKQTLIRTLEVRVFAG